MANRAVNRPAKNIFAGVFGEMIAEFLGTFVLVLFGDGAIASFLLFSNNVLPTVRGGVVPGAFTPVSWNLVALGWGFAIMLGIYVAGAVSGAHINPAVTLAFAARRKFPWMKVPLYWIAQLVGAFVAALVLWLVYMGAINHALNGNNITAVGTIFYTAPKPFVSILNAFFDEFLGTALLVGLIFAIVDIRNQPVQANLNPLIIGLLFAAIGMSFGLNTGFAVNPARDLGPRLLITGVGGGTLAWPGDYWWIPIVAPLAGGVVGAFVYDFTVHKVLEARRLAAAEAARREGRPAREPLLEERP